ncbi:beta-ketoacyl-[acyl-carrier-protein] synthase II [Gammaproteobacteria bacterium 45_16_T64]|nr:beta-ketoacyl-[acyl-carrier-protein] synthase II [Gammaproteobacteria bacterium 45_16_T64]
MPVYLNAMGIACGLGKDKSAVANKLFAEASAPLEQRSGLAKSDAYVAGQEVVVGQLPFILEKLPKQYARFDCRNNRLLVHVLDEIATVVDAAISEFGNTRVGVVLGTSTSGIAKGESALSTFRKSNQLPSEFHYSQQEIGGPSEFLASYLDLRGPALTISTACSSSAKVFASGQRLLETGHCDAVIVGGVDTLCKLTLNGFSSLSAVSADRCNPFSQNRDGINIGEGAALYLMTKKKSAIEMCGVGEASDAHHISAPHPDGTGAITAMSEALRRSGLLPKDIDYINLHGTATPQNDAMESTAVHSVFGNDVAASSTKGQVGHTLGAAGAIEVGFCYLVLSDLNKQRVLPQQIWDAQPDDKTCKIRFVQPGETLTENNSRYYCLSNSFAFGGSNVSVVIGQSS